MKTNKECVVLILQHTLKIGILDAAESGDLLVGSTRFVDQGVGSFMGFHDWLRKLSLPHQILGVRFWPHEKAYLPHDFSIGRKYISTVTSGNGIEIFFQRDKTYDEHLSGDQSFAFNKILLSPERDVALVLDMAGLSLDEVKSSRWQFNLREAHWIK